MRVFLAALLFLGLGVLGMCVAILFKKGGRFRATDVGGSEAMRKMGIRCMKEVDEEYFGKGETRPQGSCTGTPSPDCAGCAFYEKI